MFGTEQITAIQTALESAASNVVSTFVGLLPIMAIIAGLGFGIKFIRGLFKQVRNGN